MSSKEPLTQEEIDAWGKDIAKDIKRAEPDEEDDA